MDKCILCRSTKKDDVQYGDFLQNSNMSVHTFCLYLTSNLTQKGEDDEGFLGFLEDDILDEVNRIKMLRCVYCRKLGANIGCCEKKCRGTFHSICGLENGALYQYKHSFNSYCNKHIPKIKGAPKAEEVCVICYEGLMAANKKFNSVQILQAPCCHNGWFHRICLQKFAKMSGYFFKCPLCNDSKIFCEQLPLQGIFIPDQDAAWEQEPNAFAELLERPSECSAKKCIVKGGRKSKKSPLVMCRTCGHVAMHERCIAKNAKFFNCDDCSMIPEQDSGRESLYTSRNNHEDDEGEEIDVCNVSENEDLQIIRRFVENTQHQEINRIVSSGVDDCSPSPKLLRKTKRTKRICESDSPSSSADEDDLYMKPSTSGQRKQIVADLCSSEEEEDQINSRKKNICRIISDDEVSVCGEANNGNRKPCSTTVIIISDDEDFVCGEETISNNANRKRTSSITTEVACHITEKQAKLTDENIKKEIIQFEEYDSYDSEEDDPLENFTLITERGKKLFSQTHDKTLDQSDCIESKLKGSSSLETPASQHLSSETRNYEPSECSDESNSENEDPVECFTKIMERQNNISCIANRTRRRVSITTPVQTCSILNEKLTDNICLEKKSEQFSSMRSHQNVKPKERHVGFESNTKTHKNSNNFNVTRRRSTGMTPLGNIEKPNETTTSRTANTINLNVSCIAKRTRRRTVCAANLEQFLRQKREMSQIYESETDSEAESISTPENFSMAGKSVHDCCTEQLELALSRRRLDISCIANRTRRRSKSKQNCLPTLAEEEKDYVHTDSIHNSSISSDDENYDNNNCNNRRRRRHHDYTKTNKRFANEKYPMQNFDGAFLKPKVHAKYYQTNKNNVYHYQHPPHVNNRKRL